LKYLISNQY